MRSAAIACVLQPTIAGVPTCGRPVHGCPTEAVDHLEIVNDESLLGQSSPFPAQQASDIETVHGPMAITIDRGTIAATGYSP